MQLESSEVFEKVSRAPGNDVCADCKTPIAVSLGKGCLSTRFGVMLCQPCGEVHRRILKHTKIVSFGDFYINLSQEELKFLAGRSNAVVNESLEKHISVSYRRPSAFAPLVIKDEFVKAKYERGEFIEHRQESMKEIRASLLKRGKNKDTWKIRWFVLSPRESVLIYFTKEEQRVSKARISISDLNVTFAGEKCGRASALQLTYFHRGSTRNLFIASVDDNPKITVDWYNSLRHAKLQYLRIAYPMCDDHSLIHGIFNANNSPSTNQLESSHTPAPTVEETEETWRASGARSNSVYSAQVSDTVALSRKFSLDSQLQDTVTKPKVISFADNLSRDFVIEGWLIKAPPRRRDAWCRRWFVLDGRKLSYYINALDPFAKGEVFIGRLRDGYNLIDGIPVEVASFFEMKFLSDEPSSRSSLDALATENSSSSPSSSSRRLTVSGKSASRSVEELKLSHNQVGECSFTLLTPSRTFVLVAPSTAMKARWVEALAQVVCTNTLPKDNVTASTLVRKRRTDVQSLVSLLREKL